jgi:hypothetical protein
LISVIITFVLVAINPLENPYWYGAVLFKDIEIGIGLLFGLIFVLKYRDPEESPLKYGIKIGFIASISVTILPAILMWALRIYFTTLNFITLVLILGFLLITAIPLGLIIGGFLGWYYMSKERKAKIEEDREDKYGEEFFQDLIDE